jgi:hypothetical protein
MKKIYYAILIALVAALVSAACTGGKTTSNNSLPPDKSTITEGVMTTSVDNDSKPTSPVQSSFPLDTPVIYCSFKVADVMPEDMIKASWYYVKGDVREKEGELLNETVTIAASDTPSYFLAFYLDKPTAGWYKGSYRVSLSVNGTEKLSVPFTME